MTSAHRPTLDPAKGKLAPDTGIVYDRMLPGHKTLKVRQPGQGGVAGISETELQEITQISPFESTLPQSLGDQDSVGHDSKHNSGSASPSPSPEESDSAYESDDEEELRKELRQLRENKIVKQAQQPAKPKKRSWADDAVFSNQLVAAPPSYHVNDSLHSHKTKKFIKKYVQ